MRRSFLVIISFIFFSCASTEVTIESNKAEKYNRFSEKVFIIAYANDTDNELVRLLGDSITNALDSVRVESEFYLSTLDKLSLDPNSNFPNKKIEAFQPDGIMILSLKNSAIHSKDKFISLNLSSIFIDPYLEKEVWRGSIFARTAGDVGNVKIDEAMKKVGKAIISKMAEDKLLEM